MNENKSKLLLFYATIIDAPSSLTFVYNEDTEICIHITGTCIVKEITILSITTHRILACIPITPRSVCNGDTLKITMAEVIKILDRKSM